MEDLAARTAAMIGFLEAHVAMAPPSRVLGFGYSNGATSSRALSSSGRAFAAAVLMHPLIPWTPDPAPLTTRVLITAGERDPFFPPEATRASRPGSPRRARRWRRTGTGGDEIDRSEIDAVAEFLRTAGRKEDASCARPDAIPLEEREARAATSIAPAATSRR